jgi:hypothetical protein
MMPMKRNGAKQRALAAKISLRSVCPAATMTATPTNGALAKNKNPLSYDRSVLMTKIFSGLEAVQPCRSGTSGQSEV